MKGFKKALVTGAIAVAIGVTSITAMAAPGGNGRGAAGGGAAITSGVSANGTTATGVRGQGQGIRRQDGSYPTTGTRPGVGLGNGGTKQLQGIGGTGLQDGSCYVTLPQN